jgi:transcriptional regulator with XRE-family HTH domain
MTPPIARKTARPAAGEAVPDGGRAVPADSTALALVQPSLGRGLHRLRLARGLSLADASAEAGVSASFLSVVEQGRSDIAIGRLMRLMAVYGARISDLDGGTTTQEVPVVRSGEGRHVRSQAGVDLYLLAPDTDRAMMPVTTTFAPRARLANLHGHGGETFVYVLEGTLLFELPGHDPEILGPGDTASYRPDPPPVMSNIGDVPLRVIGVVSPPTL